MTTKKILGEKLILNGISTGVSAYHPDMSADTYYEVVRFMDGKIAFLPDHLHRLRNSMENSGLNCPDETTIRESLKKLVSENQFNKGNIRICLQKHSGKEPNLLCYFIPWFYPDKSSYSQGVKLVSYLHERPNPGIKKWDDRFRTNVRKAIEDQGVYEAVLVNRIGELTEGSRSNIFFIDNSNRLITAPEKQILAGITRKYVMQICREEGIKILEKPVHLKELSKLSACFISGTSPKVLPVRQIDDQGFRADHPVQRKIMVNFDGVLNDHLETII
jgi:branched-chain amino acid aminotransferase